MLKQQVKLYPPLKGVFINLEQVPDPVFAEKMVGDGYAIDPLDNVLYAPLDGTIKSIHRAKHAITITADGGFDILIHIGLETVALAGQGFKLKVKEGERVLRGAVLTVFDIAYISERVVALITPVLVTDLEEHQLSIEMLPHGIVTDLNQPIMLVNYPTKSIQVNSVAAAGQAGSANSQVSESELIKIPNLHGIHARPAALLNVLARKYPAEILLFKGHQSANVKSVVSLLSLAVVHADEVKIVVKGANAGQIIGEIKQALLELHDEEAAVSHDPQPSDEKRTHADGKYFAVVASAGIAVAKLAHQATLSFQYQRFAYDVKQELLKLNSSLSALIDQLNQEIAGIHAANSPHKDILNAHLMILTDPELNGQAKAMVSCGNSAAYAWDKSTEDSCKVLLATANQLLIERQSDLRDVRDRLLTHLCGEGNKLTAEYSEDVILVGEDFTPSQIIGLSSRVKGLVSVNGGVTSHVSILARTRAIPLLVGLDEAILREPAGQVVVLDSRVACLNVTPTPAEISRAEQQLAKQVKEQALALQSASLAATTRDGLHISCLANIGNLSEAEIALAHGGEGVGLFRTEFMFLETKQAPTEEEQLSEYLAISAKLADRPFVIRTLDAGGDKDIPYLVQAAELNPMLGVRGIRLCLAHREILKTQLRAIIRSNANNIKIMLPMISKLSEFRAVKQILEDLKLELAISRKIELGIMVEVPSVALLSAAFAKEVDFMSIGSNDLTQYVMAVDREHTELGKEVDHLHPAVISAIALTAKGAKQHATSLSVCGLMASEKIAIALLIGLGVKTLSMTVSTIAENKAFIRTLDSNTCHKAAEHCLSLTTAEEVREYLTAQFN